MKRYILAALMLITPLSNPHLLGAEAETANGGELSLPWADFQKLLNMNTNDVTLTWDEFQKILLQTGVKEPPEYKLNKGNVVLSRDEFKKILDRMKAPAAEAPKYYLTKGVYSGTIQEESSEIKATLRLEVTAKTGAIEPLRIPLFPGHVAFKEILINGHPALIENKDGTMNLIVSEAGSHLITAYFTAKSGLKKEPFQIGFSIPETPITQIDLTIPIKNLAVIVQNASQLNTASVANGTNVTASLPTTSMIQLSWNPVAPEENKGPAKIYAEVFNLLSVEEDALRVRTDVNLDVLQNTINILNITPPEGYTILDVSGDAIGDWEVRGEDVQTLVIPLKYSRKGKSYLTITAERVLKEKNNIADFNGYKIIKAVRQRGHIGIEVKGNVETKILENKDCDRVDTQDVPQNLLNLTNRPLLYAFKYLRVPYSIQLDIQKHEEVAVISTVVDEANNVTMVMEDGKMIHQLTYTIRNSWKQFLEVKLPDQAQVWNVFVEGQRVKPSKNAEGKVLIPLNRSQSTSGEMTAFDVEIMYYEPTKPFSIIGQRNMEFPIPDVLVSQMFWSVYLPLNYDYLYFNGDVEKELQAEGFKPVVQALLGAQNIAENLEARATSELGFDYNAPSSQGMRKMRAEKTKSSSFWRDRSQFSSGKAVNEDAYARQVEREISFFNQVKNQRDGLAPTDTGVLPIRVKIPNSGKVYRFTKQIIVNQEPLHLSTVFASQWIKRGLGYLLLIGLLLFLSKQRAAIKAFGPKIQNWAQKNKKLIDWIQSPEGGVFASLFLVVLLSLISRLLMSLAIVVFIIAVVRWKQNKKSDGGAS